MANTKPLQRLVQFLILPTSIRRIPARPVTVERLVAVIVYRPFLNTDIGRLAEIWRSQPPLRGRFAQVNAHLFERYVFAKPYFDRLGLIVADEEGTCIGFVHAGFGPSATLDRLSADFGALCTVQVEERSDRESIANRLIQEGENYLRNAGVKQIVAGGVFPIVPFYLGFYGGSRLPGVLVDDQLQVDRFQQAGYQEKGRVRILQIRLADFRPTVNRQQLANRRSHQVTAAFDPAADSWWEACTLGWSDRIRFHLIDKDSGSYWGQVTFWDMEPLASGWGQRCMGLYDLKIDDQKRREGRATYLVGESLRQLAAQGVALVEVQIPEQDAATLGVFSKLGFKPIGEGLRLEKHF
jgi:predicted N-acetyltransferase YhbS